MDKYLDKVYEMAEQKTANPRTELSSEEKLSSSGAGHSVGVTINHLDLSDTYNFVTVAFKLLKDILEEWWPILETEIQNNLSITDGELARIQEKLQLIVREFLNNNAELCLIFILFGKKFDSNSNSLQKLTTEVLDIVENLENLVTQQEQKLLATQTSLTKLENKIIKEEFPKLATRISLTNLEDKIIKEEFPKLATQTGLTNLENKITKEELPKLATQISLTNLENKINKNMSNVLEQAKNSKEWVKNGLLALIASCLLGFGGIIAAIVYGNQSKSHIPTSDQTPTVTDTIPNE